MAKYSTEELFELTQRDGLGETIKTVSCKKIQDPELSELWERAKEILEAVEEFFEDHRDFEDEDTEDEDNENDDRF